MHSLLLLKTSSKKLLGRNRVLIYTYTYKMSVYELPDDHPAAKLRLTEKAAKEFIFRPTMAPIIQGKLPGCYLAPCLNTTHEFKQDTV